MSRLLIVLRTGATALVVAFYRTNDFFLTVLILEIRRCSVSRCGGSCRIRDGTIYSGAALRLLLYRWMLGMKPEKFSLIKIVEKRHFERGIGPYLLNAANKLAQSFRSVYVSCMEELLVESYTASS